jgi:hypothetical protein
MKSGDTLVRDTLRLLSAAIKNREIEVGHELSDDEVVDVAVKEAKRRRESIEAFEDAGRTELADKEKAELAILAPFLPEQLSDAEVDALIDGAIASTGASSLADMGKVMGLVMAEAKGKVDGGTVQSRVKARLQG